MEFLEQNPRLFYGEILHMDEQKRFRTSLKKICQSYSQHLLFIFIQDIYICNIYVYYDLYIDNEINHALCIDFSTVTELIDLRISHRIPSLLGDVVGIILLTCGMTSG